MIVCTQLGKCGRLGNQLYQAAATIGLADLYGEGVGLPNDWSYREWFSIPDEMYGECDGVESSQLVHHIDPRAAIYLQDWNLFSHMLPRIQEYFSPSGRGRVEVAQFTEFAALKRPILSVHVRRGDNVPGQDPDTVNKHLYHPCPPLEYYLGAIKQFGDLPKSVAVFSDDIEWCEQNLEADYFHHGIARPKEHKPEYLTAPVRDQVDWFMQASCDYHVCSNSTYGIFAAIVANNEVPPVISWPVFGPYLDYIDASLLFPDNWRRLEY